MFHRFSHLIGKQPVPALRRMLPDRWTQQALAIHLLTLGLGLGAIGSQNDVLVRATGVGLLLTCFALLRMLLSLLRQRPTTPTQSS